MARSRRWPGFRRRIERLAAVALVSAALASQAAADDAVPPPVPPKTLELQLEVLINGQSTHLIGAFALDASGRLSSTRQELSALGLQIAGAGPPDERIDLARIPGLSYHYDDIKQAVAIVVPDQMRLVKSYRAEPAPDAIKPQSSTGVLLNYSAFGAASHDFSKSSMAVNGGSLNLEGRAYSSAGTLSQSGIVGTTTFANATALRLDTTYTYADEDNIRVYRAGDVVSGGLSWTRPIRLGGVQVQRDFQLRPGLVTMPLPSFSGSAAVPSTVDVYINNVKTYTQQVDSGPYNIEDLPVITGTGSARVVVTDSTGRQSEQDTDFSTSPDLLRKGLTDYSVDAGLPRSNYGTSSFSYGRQPMALASLRYGITDWLTGELHAETDVRLNNGGAGLVAGLGRLGEVTAAVSASRGGRGAGAMLFAGWDGDIARLHVSATTRRTLASYQDLASLTAQDSSATAGDLPISLDARAVDSLAASYGFPDWRASAGLGLIHVEDAAGNHSVIISGSLSKSFGNSLSVYASSFADISNRRDYGVFAGLSYVFGQNYQASSSLSLAGGAVTGSAAVAKSMDGSDGSYGWRVARGQGGASYTAADASYQGSAGLVQAEAYQHDRSGDASIAVDGALVATDGRLFLGNRIGDSFAVVDAGSSGVPVTLENRPVGTTGSDGKLLVTGLTAYEKNRIAVDITKLPATASVPRTESVVIPKAQSGVNVDFGIRHNVAAALVIVTDGDGKQLPVGTAVTLNGQSEPFIVGFDGQVYMTGLTGNNQFESTINSVSCGGQFAFKPSDVPQQVIGPVKCI